MLFHPDSRHIMENRKKEDLLIVSWRPPAAFEIGVSASCSLNDIVQVNNETTQYLRKQILKSSFFLGTPKWEVMASMTPKLSSCAPPSFNACHTAAAPIPSKLGKLKNSPIRSCDTRCNILEGNICKLYTSRFSAFFVESFQSYESWGNFD